MACSNCFNGCTEIVSDQCVKYTGVDVPVLGIKKGDSLSYVEQALITFLTSTLDGTGIKINIPSTTVICNLVQQYLPTCGDLTAVDLFNALIQAACELQAELDGTNSRIDAIESPYLPGCFTTINESSNTHTVVQEIITKVCGIESDLSSLAIDLSTNYVKLADLCNLIIECINQNTPPNSDKYYTKMVPFTAVEYYGSLEYFDSTGAGIGSWEKIYLCNGDNKTPDKRGRVPVGATSMPSAISMDTNVAPGGFNPTYNLFTKAGTNSVILSKEQIPTHNHLGSTAITTIDPSSHTHTGAFQPVNTTWKGGGDPSPNSATGNANAPTGAATLTATTNLTIAPEGGGLAHANNQPAIACYYIMYIP